MKARRGSIALSFDQRLDGSLLRARPFQQHDHGSDVTRWLNGSDIRRGTSQRVTTALENNAMSVIDDAGNAAVLTPGRQRAHQEHEQYQ